MFSITDSGGDQLAETTAEDIDSSYEPIPGPEQRRCLGTVGRGIGSLTHRCPTIGEGLEAREMDVPVGQEMARKHREGPPAPDTEVALNQKPSFARHRIIALVATMAMDRAGEPMRAVRAIAYKLAFTKLDDLSKGGLAVDVNLSLPPGPRLLLHGSIRHRSTFSTRFHAKRYTDDPSYPDGGQDLEGSLTSRTRRMSIALIGPLNSQFSAVKCKVHGNQLVCHTTAMPDFVLAKFYGSSLLPVDQWHGRVSFPATK